MKIISKFKDYYDGIQSLGIDKSLIYRRNGLYVALNPSLKALEFYRVKDSYSAFQEIAQYLGGVLTKRESIENKLSDIDKIKQHGFDVKYGFRTKKNEK